MWMDLWYLPYFFSREHRLKRIFWLQVKNMYFNQDTETFNIFPFRSLKRAQDFLKILLDICRNLTRRDELIDVALSINVPPALRASFEGKPASQYIWTDAWHVLYQWWEEQPDNGGRALFDALCAASRHDIALQYQHQLQVSS